MFTCLFILKALKNYFQLLIKARSIFQNIELHIKKPKLLRN